MFHIPCFCDWSGDRVLDMWDQFEDLFIRKIVQETVTNSPNRVTQRRVSVFPYLIERGTAK